MTNLNSRALEYTGYYAQGRKKKKTFKEPETALKIWEGFLCQNLTEIIRENESNHI